MISYFKCIKSDSTIIYKYIFKSGFSIDILKCQCFFCSQRRFICLKNWKMWFLTLSVIKSDKIYKYFMDPDFEKIFWDVIAFSVPKADSFVWQIEKRWFLTFSVIKSDCTGMYKHTFGSEFWKDILRYYCFLCSKSRSICLTNWKMWFLTLSVITSGSTKIYKYMF